MTTHRAGDTVTADASARPLPDTDPARTARGCRIDYVHPTGRSPLERWCAGQVERAPAQTRPVEERHRLLALLASAIVPAVARRAARQSPQHAVGGDQGPAVAEPGDGPDESLQAALDAELRVVEAVEAAKAALDRQALTALARMTSLSEAMVATGPAAARAVPFDAGELVALEVATATGLSQGEVGVRAELATGPVARYGRLRDLLAGGEVSLRFACQLVADTRHLGDHELVDQIVQGVFAPTRDGAGLSGSLFRARLRRAVLRADADAAAAAARRRAARERNGARAQVFDDGTGQLVVRNDAEKIAAAIERADAAARAAKAAGDPRTLDQLRADYITGAISYGQPCSGDHCAGYPDHGEHGRPATEEPVHDGDQPTPDKPDPDAPRAAQSGSDSDQASGCGPSPDWYARFGHRPPARVWIVVPVTTALGLDEAPCWLPGQGWVAAEHARAIITTDGSSWQTLLADETTGRAVRLSTGAYRPTRAMIDHVTAVDGQCRGPGCTVPAARCDLDHDIPHPAGATTVDNLTLKHRQHHRVRTAGFWRAVRDPRDARVAWTTSAGRRYVTYPTDWLEDARPTPRSADDNPSLAPEPEPAPEPESAPDPPPEPGPHEEPAPPPF